MKARFQLGTVVVLMFATTSAWADAGQAANARWSWDLGTTLPLLAALGLYGFGFARMWRRRAPIHLRQAAFFAAGWTSLFVALNSPVHAIGEQLFWVHMTQHEILVLVSAPLLVLAHPLVPFLWALPQPWRQSLGEASKLGGVRRTWALLTAPLAAWMLHAAALWVWHAPALFEATLRSDFVHALQHISFLGTALLFWWALIHAHHGRRGGAVVYLFTTVVHTSILGALLTFAPVPWYPSYNATAPLWGLSALQDQQIGGLVMWVPSGALLTGIALAFLATWLREGDRRFQYTRMAALARAAAGDGNEN
jgi:putative membrane protein